MDPTRAMHLARELQVSNSSDSRTLHFHGESMLPFFREGDGLVVQPVEWERIRIGDIIAYRFADKFPARRVIRKSGERLVLWCENWPGRFFQAAKDDVLGRVVARERNGSWLSYDEPPWRRATRRALLRFHIAGVVNKAIRMWSKGKRRFRALRKSSQAVPASSPPSPDFPESRERL